MNIDQWAEVSGGLDGARVIEGDCSGVLAAGAVETAELCSTADLAGVTTTTTNGLEADARRGVACSGDEGDVVDGDGTTIHRSGIVLGAEDEIAFDHANPTTTTTNGLGGESLAVIAFCDKALTGRLDVDRATCEISGRSGVAAADGDVAARGLGNATATTTDGLGKDCR